ncbi:alpha amylase C-terminal domain-containing protein, partial [candidate division NPL-UPA2 bacterium]|nr:alpha amylase C-terminal domain-containing protein [candidate division NPL-UPA2 bacterium]
SERIYGKETIRSTLVGNHDKARFMAYADGDLPDPDINDEREVGYANPPKVDHDTSYAKLKNALTFIFTIDGAPMIYYGDEIGMTGAGDPDNRRDMRFGDELTSQEKDMLDFTGRLSRIRNDHPALRYGSRHTVLLEQDVYAYARAYFSDRLLVVFNKSDRDKQVRFCVSPDLPAGTYTDLLGGQKTRADKKGFFELTVPSRSSMIFSNR